MDYKSFEYIRKTLPNEFNWSILYQLFEEDEIELSEAAENYLRTTPWNTNVVILSDILDETSGGGDDDLDSITIYMCVGGEYGNFDGTLSDLHTPQEVIDFCEAHKEQDEDGYFTTAVTVKWDSGDVFSTRGVKTDKSTEWIWQDADYEQYFTLTSEGGNYGSWN